MAEVLPSSAKTLRAVGQVSPNEGASLSINRKKTGVSLPVLYWTDWAYNLYFMPFWSVFSKAYEYKKMRIK